MASPVLNALYGSPMLLEDARTVDRIGVYVYTAGAAGSVLRLGVYAFDPNTGLPGALMDDFGTVDAALAGDRAIVINRTYGPGWIFLAAVAQVAVPSVYATGGSGLVPSIWSAGEAAGWYKTAVSGALPDPFGVPTAHFASGIRTALRLV